MSGFGETRRGPPLGRHVAAVAVTVALLVIFVWISGNDGGYEPFYLGHEVLADASVVLLCLILVLGPAARFVPRVRPFVPWGRELGIAMFVTAGLHVAMLNDFSIDVIGFFGQDTFRGFEWDTSMWGAANWVGAFALVYALVLTAISNDWSQRKLGRGWKFIQRQTYTLFLLTWLHVAAFAVIGAGHGALLSVELFWSLTAVVVVLQFAGFVHTVRSPRGPSPHRVPPRSGDARSGVVSSAALRWLGVVVLWGGLIFGSWVTTHFESEEERQVARLCERYEELSDSPLSEIQDELSELAPDGESLSEWLLVCREG